jgi:hypothetical protein
VSDLAMPIDLTDDLLLFVCGIAFPEHLRITLIAHLGLN